MAKAHPPDPGASAPSAARGPRASQAEIPVRARPRKIATIALTVLLACVAVALLVIRLWPEAAAEAGFRETWARYAAARVKLQRDASALAEIEQLEAMVGSRKTVRQEGYALWLAALARYREAFLSDKVSGEDRAPHLVKVIEHLEALGAERFDDALLLTKARWYSPDAQPPVDRLLARARADLEWAKANPYTEPAPSTDVVGVLRTSLGDIHLHFFPELAPRHVENFLKLASLGTYNGTAFHYLAGGPLNPLGLMGGDPYSFFYNDSLKKKHILRWGSGTVGYDLPPEKSRNAIRHRRGVVTSQRLSPGDWDNGLQFQIVLAHNRELDHRHSPFAVVAEGMDVLEKIVAAGKTAGQHASYRDDTDFARVHTRDLLIDPVRIYKVIVYRDGRAVEHAYRLEEGEKSLSTLPDTPAKPLAEENGEAFCGRLLRNPAQATEIRRGLDIPFPADVDATKESEKGDRSAVTAPPSTPPSVPPPGDPPKDEGGD
ncbi:MAG: peptidylprolyl isomerase [Planctomycetaceae bacterium]